MQKFKVKSTSLTRTALTMTLLVIASIAVMNKALSAGSTPGAIANPIRYGRVNNAQLSDLAPANSRALRDLLLHRRFDEAASDLQRELSQYPGSLAGYVGLMQVEPERWPVEIKRLRGEIAKQSANRQPPKPTDLFKLGTLLYYQWGQQPAPPRDRKQLAEAQALLAHAWHSDHAPIIGLMLGEMLGVEAASSDPSVKGLNTKKSARSFYMNCVALKPTRSTFALNLPPGTRNLPQSLSYLQRMFGLWWQSWQVFTAFMAYGGLRPK